MSDELPVLIGQVPLERLEWVVDPKNQRLIGNPEHGGEHMIDGTASVPGKRVYENLVVIRCEW